jgi:very-long-chain (3R)-3-hydroxyacyl-CoA dehydratase
MLIKLYNLISFIGWVIILLLNLINHPNILVIQIVQSIAILDVLFAFFKIIKTNYLIAFIQILSRYFIVWGPFYFGNVPHLVIRLLSSFWALSDSVRYLYYYDTTNLLVKTIRYNLFWILYPLGIIFEVISCYYSPIGNHPILYLIAFLYIKFGIDLYKHMMHQHLKKN